MEWYFAVLKKYAVFTGRARRKEYWMFSLISVVVAMILVASDAFTNVFDMGYGIGFLTSIYILATIIPGLAVTVRRLHDTGRSGFWYFITFVPFIGWIVMFVFTVQDSQPGSNEYGDNPKSL